MEKSLCLLVFLCIVFEESSGYVPLFFRGRPKEGMLKAPYTEFRGKLPPDQWMTQKLDHFNDADSRSWQQRYFVNDTFYMKDGPVFLMIGGEGTANPIWMVDGTWIDYAKNHGALCLMLEHRYYGKSHPTANLSDANLQYLSSEQALADLAHFIEFAKANYSLQGSNGKWIAFGGSYPGSLAAWFRMKFPHLVTAAVASSAPLRAVLDFSEYLDVVRASLETSKTKCTEDIHNATATLTSLITTDTGRKQIQTLFKLCDPIDSNNTLDISNLFQTLSGNFDGVVQYNNDNRAFEGAVGTNITIDVVCGIMSNHKLGEPLERYAAVNTLTLKTYSQECLDYKYTKMIKTLQEIDWNSSASEGGRQWTYQTCTEFGFFQTSDHPKQPFGHFFPVNFSVQQCMDIFGPSFDMAEISAGINRTNENYGGLGMRITRTVFPNGSIDPWHALGATKDLRPDGQALYINGTAHCANMYPSSPDDPPQLQNARALINNNITQWLSKKIF